MGKKKLIKDLTLEEMVIICKHNKACDCCPLANLCEYFTCTFEELEISELFQYVEEEKMFAKKKTPLENFQDIKELEVADGPEITVVDILPYKCKQVEQALKAFEIIKKNAYNSGICITYLKSNSRYSQMKNYEHYCMTIRECDRVSEDEFNLLKEVLENE